MGTIKFEDFNKALNWEQSRLGVSFVGKKIIYCRSDHVLNSSVLIKEL